ncbi:MAG TPA: class I SAM-dependent methyltransferase [Acidimicrobiia bacterium]|jgi:SAM-dependent methyltransferase
MIHETIPPVDLTDAAPARPAEESVTDADLGISAQARSMRDLEWVLDRLIKQDPAGRGGLLDIGCGMGALTAHIGGRLGTTELTGVDLDSERLKGAAARGIRPLLLDLNTDALPLASGSKRVVTCFGVLAYLNLYDNVLGESARVLADGGWLLLSMPNLASYANRLALFFGYQPQAVAVSRFRQAGMRGRRRNPNTSANMPPLLHAASLRCMREILDNYGFDVEVVRGFAPGERHGILDRITRHFPGLSRRFLILARKRATA